jgi:hypothetical protein
MCLMHKSDPYGKILLKQKFKQTPNQILNFASQLAIFFPYDRQLIERSLAELVGEDVLQIEGDLLVQKRDRLEQLRMVIQLFRHQLQLQHFLEELTGSKFLVDTGIHQQLKLMELCGLGVMGGLQHLVNFLPDLPD